MLDGAPVLEDGRWWPSDWTHGGDGWWPGTSAFGGRANTMTTFTANAVNALARSSENVADYVCSDSSGNSGDLSSRTIAVRPSVALVLRAFAL